MHYGYGYGNGGDHWGMWILMIIAMVGTGAVVGLGVDRVGTW
jgi:hypothetical protein